MITQEQILQFIRAQHFEIFHQVCANVRSEQVFASLLATYGRLRVVVVVSAEDGVVGRFESTEACGTVLLSDVRLRDASKPRTMTLVGSLGPEGSFLNDMVLSDFADIRGVVDAPWNTDSPGKSAS